MIYRLDENNNLICSYKSDYPYFQEDWNIIETDLLPNDSFHIKHWNGSEWIEGLTESELAEANKPKVPEIVSRRQFKIALAILGHNENDILNGIEQLPEPNRTIANISYTESGTFERYSSDLIYVSKTFLGLTDEEIDEVFLTAITF